jgi:hypothetical protein
MELVPTSKIPQPQAHAHAKRGVRKSNVSENTTKEPKTAEREIRPIKLIICQSSLKWDASKSRWAAKKK